MSRKIETIKSFFDRNDKKKLIILFIFLILTTILEILSLGILIPIAYDLLGLIDNKTSIQNTIEIFYKLMLFDSIIYNLVFVTIIFTLKNLFIFLFNKYRIDTFAKIYLKKSYSSYKSYLNKNLEEVSELNKNKPSQLIVNELRILLEKFFEPLIVIFSELLVLITIILFLMFTGQKMIIYIIIFFSILGLIYSKFLSRLFSRLGEKRRINELKTREIISEGIAGFKDIKILKKEDFYLNRFSQSSKKFVNSAKFFSYFFIVPRILIEISIITIFTIIIIYSSTDGSKDYLESTIIFLIISYRLMPLVSRLAINFNTIRFTMPVLGHFKNQNLKNYNSKNIKKHEKTNLIIKKYIKINKLYFKYKKSKSYLLKNINLKIKKNSLIGIFGPSGSGKTTLVNLLSGLLKPTKGGIYLDKTNINNVIYDYQLLIAYISQDTYIMNDTVLNNITFGKKLDLLDKKKLTYCIKKTGLGEAIKNKKGVNTVISEDGKNFSGGQKQRIAIARALFHNKQILILDEATSALDKKSQKEIISLIKKLKKNKTIILISHEKELVNQADLVFNL